MKNEPAKEICFKIVFWGIFALVFWAISYFVYQLQPGRLWTPLLPFYYAYSIGNGVGVIAFVATLAVIMELKDISKRSGK